MRVEVKRTFLHFVDDDDLLGSLTRNNSAPALLTSKELARVCKPKDSSDDDRAKDSTDDDRAKGSSDDDSTKDSADDDQAKDSADDDRTNTPMTTVIMQNIPPALTRQSLLDLLDAEGFSCTYDFVYVPIKIKCNCAFGYAFINFTNTTSAKTFLEHFKDFSRWPVPHDKNVLVDWSNGHQGLQAQIDRYGHSTMMGLTTPDEWKPIVLKDGRRIRFPTSSKAKRARQSASQHKWAFDPVNGVEHRQPQIVLKRTHGKWKTALKFATT